MEILKKLADHHKEWINILMSFGCDKSLAEDLTQEMYIKVHNYLSTYDKSILLENGDVNRLFVYVTLRNLYFDLHRQKKRIEIVSLEDYKELFLEEEIDIYEDNSDEMFEMYSSIEDWYSDELFLELLEKDEIKEIDYTKEELSSYYMRRIFKEVFYEDINVSELSRNTKITYWSLRNTIKIIKKQIKKYYETRRRIGKNI